MNPRSEALALRIWSWCQAHGWEHTAADVAAALDVPTRRVARVAKDKGWADRFRTTFSWDVPMTRTILGRETTATRITRDNARIYGIDKGVIE